MPTDNRPTRSREEIRTLGETIRQKIQAESDPKDHRKYVAINVDCNTWEIDRKLSDAMDRLRRRSPTGDVWLARVGSPTVYRL